MIVSRPNFFFVELALYVGFIELMETINLLLLSVVFYLIFDFIRGICFYLSGGSPFLIYIGIVV